MVLVHVVIIQSYSGIFSLFPRLVQPQEACGTSKSMWVGESNRLPEKKELSQPDRRDLWKRNTLLF
jgi:hypothetical protein